MERRLVDVQADRRVDGAVGQLIVRMAKENPDWGYDRIAAALAQFGVSHYWSGGRFIVFRVGIGRPYLVREFQSSRNSIFCSSQIPHLSSSWSTELHPRLEAPPSSRIKGCKPNERMHAKACWSPECEVPNSGTWRVRHWIQYWRNYIQDFPKPKSNINQERDDNAGKRCTQL